MHRALTMELLHKNILVLISRGGKNRDDFREQFHREKLTGDSATITMATETRHVQAPLVLKVAPFHHVIIIPLNTKKSLK